MVKKYRTPPFLTPSAIVSLIVAISAANLAVNVATGTSEGKRVVPRESSISTSAPIDSSRSDSTTSAVSDSESAP
ncbi:hypothetical protein Q604_UNBC07458G0001, partial [human gut metagenome]